MERITKLKKNEQNEFLERWNTKVKKNQLDFFKKQIIKLKRN